MDESQVSDDLSFEAGDGYGDGMGATGISTVSTEPETDEERSPPQRRWKNDDEDDGSRGMDDTMGDISTDDAGSPDIVRHPLPRHPPHDHTARPDKIQPPDARGTLLDGEQAAAQDLLQQRNQGRDHGESQQDPEVPKGKKDAATRGEAGGHMSAPEGQLGGKGSRVVQTKTVKKLGGKPASGGTADSKRTASRNVPSSGDASKRTRDGTADSKGSRNASGSASGSSLTRGSVSAKANESREGTAGERKGRTAGEPESSAVKGATTSVGTAGLTINMTREEKDAHRKEVERVNKDKEKIRVAAEKERVKREKLEVAEATRRAAEVQAAIDNTPWGALKWCRVTIQDSIEGDVITVEDPPGGEVSSKGFPFLTDTTGYAEARSKVTVRNGQKKTFGVDIVKKGAGAWSLGCVVVGAVELGEYWRFGNEFAGKVMYVNSWRGNMFNGTQRVMHKGNNRAAEYFGGEGWKDGHEYEYNFPGDNFDFGEGDVVEVCLDLECDEGVLSFKKGKSAYPAAIMDVKKMVIRTKAGMMFDDIRMCLTVQMSNTGDKARLFYPYGDDEVDSESEDDELAASEGDITVEDDQKISED